MRSLNLCRLALVVLLSAPTLSFAEDVMLQFPLSDPTRWDYFSDQVMGGVSEGKATFENIGDQSILRLTGRVSTANRGGFIQAEIRAKVGDALRGGISWRCSDAVDSLLRKGYATCQSLPSPNCPIHPDLARTRSRMSSAMARAS